VKTRAEKLTQVLDYIERNPDSWDQRCSLPILREYELSVPNYRTACSFAGRACLLHGWSLPDFPEDGPLVSKGDRTLHPFQAAAIELELAYDQAESLFRATNTLADLRRIVANIIDGP
jgi:hypothetical protein